MPPWLEYALGDFKFRPRDMGLRLRTVGSLRDTDAEAQRLAASSAPDLTFWRAIYKTGKLGRKWECSLSTVVCAYTVECLNMTNFTPLWREMCREMDENFSLQRNATAAIAVKLSPCSDIHHISNISCSNSTFLRNLSYLLACCIYTSVHIHLLSNYNTSINTFLLNTITKLNYKIISRYINFFTIDIFYLLFYVVNNLFTIKSVLERDFVT